MNRDSNQRVVILGIFTIVVLIYIVRLAYIQLWDTGYLASANNNVLRYVTIYPSRGFVYDRKGKLLVYNQQVFDLMVTPRLAKDIDTNDFCNIIGITKADYITKMNKAKAYSKYKASVFEKQLNAVSNAMLQEKMYKFSGFYTVARTIRYYPEATAAHIMGYIGEVDDKVIEKNPYYKSGDYIGISGIELSYEKYLRGKRGLKVVMVDVHNNEKGSFQNGIYDSSAVAGDNLILSIDEDLQKYAEQLMQNKIGGVVAIEPGTGEILALVSSPSYDPNLLVGRERTKNYSVLMRDPLKPLYNRAMQAYYPPGSTFKLVNALLGQQEGIITEHTVYPCYFAVGSHRVKCHGPPYPSDLRGAIQHSCNPYFCQVFKNFVDAGKWGTTEKGYRTWYKDVLSFGVGRKIGVDMPHELSGLVPKAEYYDKYYGKGHWRGSTIFSLGIGQGELGLNPMQMANIMCIIANKGYYYVPHIVKNIGNKKYTPQEFLTKHYTVVDEKYFIPVQDGMQAVVEAGTGRIAKNSDYTVCGKTGTAQNPHGKDHSLFVCFAPRENPKIAIGIMVENAGYGATYAGPIASLMMEKYLTDTIKRPELEKRMMDAVILPQPKTPDEDVGGD